MGLRPHLAFMLATACQGSSPGSSGFGSTPGVTPEAASTTDAASTGTSGEGTGGTTSGSGGSASSAAGSDTADGTTATVLDVGSKADVGDGKPAGCKGKIDFLFVISRHTNMNFVQTQLIKAFPSFIATIETKFDEFDYHIMVVDGGGGWGSDWCNQECTNQGCPGLSDYPCDLLELVTECDETLGAGSVFPAGYNAANKPCPVASDKRFLTRGQADLPEAFACVAQVGGSGRGWIGEALVAAMSPPLNGSNACNKGFLREDALLMITLLTADWDDEGKPLGSAGTADDWAQAVIDAKSGDMNAVVVLDIGDAECPWPEDRLCEMTKMFPFHYVEDIAASDYSDAFDKASSLVEDACAGFVAPG